MTPELLLARRAAVGLAAQVAQGNEDEFTLLMKFYVTDARELGITQGPALALLAQTAIGLAVLAHKADVEWFQGVATELAVE
jgi:acyl-coenzyme A thioesterase PaaI-like protein